MMTPGERTTRAEVHRAARFVSPRGLTSPSLQRPMVARVFTFDRAALRSGRDYLHHLESRWTGPERPVSTPVTALGALRDRGHLHLGESASLGTLLAVLPRGYLPMTHPDQALVELGPELAASAACADDVLAAPVFGVGSPSPSLFWMGWCGRTEAWTLATARGREESSNAPLWVGPSRQGRQLVAPTIRVDGLGRVSVSARPAPLAWSHDGHGFVEDDGGTDAALADYYLWWAWRLYGYAREVSRSPWDLYLATAAARRGLAALSRISEVVRHLDLHLNGSIEAAS